MCLLPAAAAAAGMDAGGDRLSRSLWPVLPALIGEERGALHQVLLIVFPDTLGRPLGAMLCSVALG